MSIDIAVALGIGLAAGLLSGILGVGGGLVAIPGMVLLLGVDQHTAQGVSLAVIVPVALVGAITHYRQGNVKLSLALGISSMAVIFALIGAWVAGIFAPQLLSRIFALMMLIIGVRMILGPRRLWCRH